MSDKNIDAIVDSYNIKYGLALKFVNKILVNAGKPEITQLTDFKDVIRQEIMTEINLQSLNDMENDIYKYFDKVKCGFYRKSDNYIINCLRGIMKQINFSIILTKKDKTVSINGENYRKKYMIYHIKKN